MENALIKIAVRTRFRLLSRAKATGLIRAEADCYAALVENLGPERCAAATRVPPMRGVDEDMRDWSLFQILEHNAIVNRSIGRIVQSLGHGEEPAKVGNPKTDVMPSANPGEEQLDAFRDSVNAYLETVSALPKLRGTPEFDHPLFGPLDAHGWHCMLGLHLTVHRAQAEAVAAILEK